MLTKTEFEQWAIRNNWLRIDKKEIQGPGGKVKGVSWLTPSGDTVQIDESEDGSNVVGIEKIDQWGNES